MPQQTTTAIENNFTKGLITEATSLNFPENAATECDNCEFTHIGEILRRLGVDYEDNYATASVDRTNKAVSTYKWNNVGGDGVTQIYVVQIGGVIYFYNISTITSVNSLSSNRLASTVTLTDFLPDGASLDATLEAQYTDGNGYLFIFHPNCDPIYCSYDSGIISGNRVNIQIRDFQGLPEPDLTVNTRPSTLSTTHSYNLQNQGWTQGQAWSASSTTAQTAYPLGSRAWTVAAGIVGITPGQTVNVNGSTSDAFGRTTVCQLAGTVVSYVGTTLTITIFAVSTPSTGTVFTQWNILPINVGYINDWFADVGSYPSNADVWWYFRNAAGAFDPGTTQAQVTLSAGEAPKGHYIFSAFQIDRSAISGLSGLPSTTTLSRPTIGTWFQGRVWYAGVNASQAATSTSPYYTWSENIYFSQVNVGTSTNFGHCYQENDPTSEKLFDILPTDGGVIQIQGSGAVYKLFPIQNGLLVFATNGVWFITGSQGIGFSASDYTITKISSVESISSTSFVDVLGLPYFWNEEGIYAVKPQQGGGLAVEPLTTLTIQAFYDDIPRQSKRYVRGAYNPIDFVIQWIYKSEEETSITDRYTFDRMLNFSTDTQAFYPYTVDTTSSSINSITYIQGPGSLNTFEPTFKYLVSLFTNPSYNISIGDMHNEDYVDWASSGNPVDYESYFITGFKLRGQGIRKYQPQYIQVFSKQDGEASAYRIQGLWDYANSGDSGKWTSIQTVNNALARFNTAIRRHRIRGRGFALQFKILSVSGMPFAIQGWVAVDNTNTGT